MLPRWIAFLVPTLVVLGLALSPRHSGAEPAPVFLLKWGSFCDSRPGPACTGLLNEPYDLAVSPGGDIYVSDTVNQRIQQFGPTGTFIRTWGSFCNISNGTGCVDPDAMGPLALGDGEFWDPVGLMCDAAGNVHVAEWSNDRVQVFGPTGSFIRKWGSTGTADGQFDTADDVAFDSQGRVFVVDKLNNRIQRFSSTGVFQIKWGSFGTNDGQFKKPVGIAIDSNDIVFVAEQEGNRIQKFTTAGVFVAKWGTFGSGPGQFNQPIHIAVDASDNIYVPDSKNHRIQKFDNSGGFLSTWGTFCNIGDGTGCVDPDGVMGPLQLGDGQFNEPEGVTVDALGDIYVVDTRNHRVQKFSPSGGGGPGAECNCPTTPPDDRAAFKVGSPRPVAGNPDQIEVPLLVNTSEDATFTQMTIEYDSNCMTYVSTATGADVTTPGAITDIDDLGAVDPGSDRNLTVNASGNYTGCDQEVFVVTFEFTAGGGPCDLEWDPTPGGANSNNHLNYDTASGGDGRIFPPDITFCPGQVDREPCPACDPMALPPDDTAVFKVGTTQVSGTQLLVPLLVDTRESVTFTQMTIEYNSACMTYASTAAGADLAMSGGITDIDDAGAVSSPTNDRNLTLNASGNYTGCDREVFVVTFDLVAGPPCDLVWDPTPGGPNSNNHLNYSTMVGGGDGKIIPPDIVFCDGTGNACNNSNVQISGTVEYFSNGTSIIAARPDPTSVAVTVEDRNDQNPTTTAASPNGNYTLSFGVGPQNVEIEALRPLVVCGTNEDGVVGGDDVIALQNDVNPPPSTTDPKLRIAGDVNRDGSVNNTDVVAIKRWIARKVCDGTDACGQAMNNNCAGTWRFIFLTGGPPPGFEVDEATLPAVCPNTTVDIEGILVGDFDGSWPNFLPKPASNVGLSLAVQGVQDGEVTVALEADLDAGESLRHVIYSLTYDAGEFAYQGLQLGSKATDWEFLDNPDEAGVTHGIVHMPPQATGLRQSGEIARFHFRALKPNAVSRLELTRSKANDLDVRVAALEISSGGSVGTDAVPVRYSLRSQPNPFNPSTRIGFTIPAGAGEVPVSLRVYDIAGRLVRTLVQAPFGPGEHHALWNGKSDDGQTSGAGVYIVRIHAGAWTAFEKVTLVK